MVPSVAQRPHVEISSNQLLSQFIPRIGKLIAAILLGAIGFLYAPADMLPGPYTATITIESQGQTYVVTHPFELGTVQGDASLHTYQVGPYQAVVEAADAYLYNLGSQIAFRVQILDDDGQVVAMPLHGIHSTIQGPEYEQALPATNLEDGWHSFAMRVPYKAKFTLALLFAVAVMWITEVVPLAATALLIPVLATLAGITDATTVLEPFANPIIALFMAGFLLAETMRRTGVDKRIALVILNRASHNPIYLMLTLMAITSFLCLWMSNTASASLMIPIALAIVSRIPEDKLPKGYSRALVLAIAYSATIGGVGSALGTPPNILAMSFLNQYTDGQLTFVNWFAYGLPFVVIMLPIIWIYLLLTFRVSTRGIDARIDPSIYQDEMKKLGAMDNGQKALLAVFVVIVLFWLTESWHHIPPAISALGGVCVLFFGRLIKEESLNNINWNALLTFGGGLSIGTLLVTTGVSDWLALQLIGLTALPTFAVLVMIIGVTVLIGAFISNTACAAMLIPIAIPLAQILNLDPRLLVTVIAISCSVDFALVTGTPPTMLAYSTGMFSVGDIFKRGVIVDLIGILILSFGVVWIWSWLGIVTL